MPTAAIVILIIIVVALIALGAILYLRRRRSERLRSDFGSEYDRKIADAPSRSAGEKALTERQKRYRELDIRPLDRVARDSYRTSWNKLQGQFVDSPADAVRQADTLVIAIMRSRGYPTDNFDQRAEDISVEHPEVVEHYRAAHQVAMAQQRGHAGTEQLRRAAISYRSLVDALLEDPAEASNGNDAPNSFTRPRQQPEHQPGRRPAPRSPDRSAYRPDTNERNNP
jgi:hypothetical protein